MSIGEWRQVAAPMAGLGSPSPYAGREWTKAARAACATLLLVASTVSAQFGGFAPHVTYAAGTNPRSVAIADLDGDGDNDLAVINSNSANVVAIFMNSGNGTFAAQVTYAAGIASLSIAIADLDADGDNDLAVADLAGSNVSILRNNGNGTFAARVTYGVEAGPVSVAIADLDTDGDNDLAVVNLNSETVSILRNNGNGTFAAQVTYAAGQGPQSISVADLDADGDRDLAVANGNNSTNTLSILRNNGDGTFAARVEYAAGTTVANGPRSVAIADLNGDGDLDAAIANSSPPGSVSVLQNNGNGTFGAWVAYPVAGVPNSIASADLDADGDNDLFVAARLTTIAVLFNNGNGTFGGALNYGVGNGAYALAIADLDGNTSFDVAVANEISNNISVLINLTDVFPPGAFTLTTPADGATGLPLPDDIIDGWAIIQPALRWTRPNSFAEPTYDVTIATDAALTNIVAQQSNLTQRQFNLLSGILESGTAYYWSITANNQAGSTLSSPSPATFRTAGVCPGDANNDQTVNFADITTVLTRFLNVCP